MKKYHYACPECGTELELRKRVTLNRRGCPTCNFEISPSEIDTQEDARVREQEAKEKAWEEGHKQRRLEREAKQRMERLEKEKHEFVEREIQSGQAKYDEVIDTIIQIAALVSIFVVMPIVGVCSAPRISLTISLSAFGLCCLLLLLAFGVRKLKDGSYSRLRSDALLKYEFLHMQIDNVHAPLPDVLETGVQQLQRN